MATITIRAPDDLREGLEAYCRKHDRSIASALRIAIKQLLEEDE